MMSIILGIICAILLSFGFAHYLILAFSTEIKLFKNIFFNIFLLLSWIITVAVMSFGLVYIYEKGKVNCEQYEIIQEEVYRKLQ